MEFMVSGAVQEKTDASTKLTILEGASVWPGYLNRSQQIDLAAIIFSLVSRTPFYRPRMPRSGRAFSVEETNFGSLGWYSDISGYRYEKLHPVTGNPWPAIPECLNSIWRELTGCTADPECCLINLYRAGARMGLHQDRDEEALDAPVLSISLGDDAVFRIGGTVRRGPTRNVLLHSGEVIVFGGAARLAFHGIDRIVAGTSTIVPGGGRLNLTLRRVSPI
jgi:alkylated DNA repair protein (DNA oxidative demethylase)